jgi:hypothetical protein
MNASTSSGVAGNPVNVNATRWISVSRSASVAGARPSSSSRARMKRSMSLTAVAPCVVVDVGVGRRDAPDQLAARGVAGHDRGLARRLGQLGRCGVAQVQTQARFARVVVGPMTAEAVVRQDRPHVPIEVGRGIASIARGQGAAEG